MSHATLDDCTVLYWQANGAMQKGKEFSSFEELEAAVNELQNVYHHPLRVFNSPTVQDMNRRRQKSKSVLKPINEKWRYTYLSYR